MALLQQLTGLCCLSEVEPRPKRAKSLSVDEVSPRKDTLPVYLRGNWGRKRPQDAGDVPIITIVPPNGRETLLFQEGKVAIRPSSSQGFLSC